MVDIAKNVKELIKESGATQTVVAGELNVSQQQLNNVLSGRRPFPVKWVEPLCIILHCDPNTLFGWDVYFIPQDSNGVKTYRSSNPILPGITNPACCS